jgi:spermidine synthase
MPIALRRLSPSATITVVEIEPQAEALARHYFRLTDEHRIRTITEDGRRFLAQDHTQYDLIVGDAYGSLYATPPHLVTREFFDLVRDRLTPGGIFFMNAIGSSETDSRSLLYSEVKTLRAVFSDVALFAIDDASDPGVQNFVLLARNVPPDTKTDWGAFMRTSNDHFLASLAEREVSLTGSFLARYDIYTDDYAPVERDSRSIMDAPRART